MQSCDYDAVVVGSGPNGLAAAITLQREGLSVLIMEAKETIGGGMRTQELTLPGFHHDVCSAVFPLGADSPFFDHLPLDQHGLHFITPDISAAHPFMDGSAAVVYRSVAATAATLNEEGKTYQEVIGRLVKDWPFIRNDILGPLRFPRYPLRMARFGFQALSPAIRFAERFSSDRAKALFAGMAAHSIQPLHRIATAAFGLVMLATAHTKGWPIAKGGAATIAGAMAAYFVSLGGRIQTSFEVRSLTQLPSARAVLFDVTPKQLLTIAGERLSPFYASQLRSFRYGAGVFKIDWALDAPTPFVNEQARQAGTLHLANSMGEMIDSEEAPSQNRIAERPFVLFSQPSVFDNTRAPEGKHTAWAYCHVPNGSDTDMTDIIEKQVERFAPGFRERILGRHTMNTTQMQQYNNNYIGGDINGGSIDIRQLFTRPALRLSPYRTSERGLYLCSSSTPPGEGVHGMCGFHAAKSVLKDVFRMKLRDASRLRHTENF